MIYNKIKIYLRQTSQNRINPVGRPQWFNYEKAFVNLLKTINYNFSDLTIVFDRPDPNHFTYKYVDKFNFRIAPIDVTVFNRKSQENDGSSKSGALTAEIVKNDNISDDTIICIFENDYIYLNNWGDALLDLYNNLYQYSFRNPDLHYVSLYNHPDTYWMIDPTTNTDRSMYKDLQSKFIMSRYCYWRYLPLLTSNWILPKRLFDRDYEFFYGGLSDNTHCDTVAKKNETYFLSPIPGFACHCQLPWITPFVDWGNAINV